MKLIFYLDYQRKYENSCATIEFQNEFVKLFNRQRPFASGNDIIKLVGKCPLIPSSKRSPRNSFTLMNIMLL